MQECNRLNKVNTTLENECSQTHKDCLETCPVQDWALIASKIKTFAYNAQARDAFYKADRNNDQSLDLQEFRVEYLKEYPAANEDEIVYKFFEIDTDADDLITFEETKAYFNSNKGKLSLNQTPGSGCFYKCGIWYQCIIRAGAFCGMKPTGCNCL